MSSMIPAAVAGEVDQKWPSWAIAISSITALGCFGIHCAESTER